MIRHSKLFKFITAFLLLLCSAINTYATEGGSSGYLQGTYGEFASGMLGDSGFYMRDDLFFYNASIDVNPVGGAISLGSTQDIWANLLKIAYVSDFTILGGRYNATIAVPLVLNGAVTAKAGGFERYVFKVHFITRGIIRIRVFFIHHIAKGYCDFMPACGVKPCVIYRWVK